ARGGRAHRRPAGALALPGLSAAAAAIAGRRAKNSAPGRRALATIAATMSVLPDTPSAAAFVPASDHPTALIERVREAVAARTPLRSAGGGSKAGLHAPVDAEAFDVRGHRGILSHEPSELVVTVRAGTPLAELEAALAEQGQCLPFEPPRLGPGGTVGGAIASGLAGPARASVGGARDYVLGARLINGRGELLTFGGQGMQ